MLEVFKIYLRREKDGETLLSKERLDNIDDCVQSIMDNDVPGDLIECGVWRGGACMFMRALLMEYGDTTRTVWVADSFQGCPPQPNVARYPLDASIPKEQWGMLACPLEVVRGNFQKYGLEDKQVRYLPGWFKDSLRRCPIRNIALLRLDGDFYESTIQPLQYLYDKVSLGGFVIVDDYHHFPQARAATDDFRAARKITAPLQFPKDVGVYWQVDAPPPARQEFVEEFFDGAPGQVVRLRSGGPKMTVAAVEPENRGVWCYWLEGEQGRRAWFLPHDLVVP